MVKGIHDFTLWVRKFIILLAEASTVQKLKKSVQKAKDIKIVGKGNDPTEEVLGGVFMPEFD